MDSYTNLTIVAQQYIVNQVISYFHSDFFIYFRAFVEHRKRTQDIMWLPVIGIVLFQITGMLN